MYYRNPSIESLNRIFDQNDRSGYLRLDLNENPGGLPQSFVDSVLEDISPSFVAQYPETAPFTNQLAEYLHTTTDRICLVNGSAEGIRYIFQAFSSPGGKVVSVTPSYFMFQIYSEMYDRNHVRISYNDDLKMDVGRIMEELTEDTQLLILLNPNNPMGNVYTDAEFESLMQVAREKQITVLVDEAYHYFYPKSFIRYALEDEHVFVVRTFSKFFSMAGCRLGYVAGWPDGIKMVQKLCTPHNTNAFALRFASEILKNPDLIEKLDKDFRSGREYLIRELDNRGYAHIGDAGNFLFIKPKTDATVLVDRMKNEKNILIKSYSNIGKLGLCLRVTIGGTEYMKQFLDALVELDQ